VEPRCHVFSGEFCGEQLPDFSVESERIGADNLRREANS